LKLPQGTSINTNPGSISQLPKGTIDLDYPDDDLGDTFVYIPKITPLSGTADSFDGADISNPPPFTPYFTTTTAHSTTGIPIPFTNPNIQLRIQKKHDKINELDSDFQNSSILSVLLNVATCISKYYSEKVYGPDYSKIIKRLFQQVKNEIGGLDTEIIKSNFFDKLNILFNIMYLDRPIPYAEILNKCFNRVDIKTSVYESETNDSFIIENIKALLREAIASIPTSLKIKDYPQDAAENVRALSGALRSVSLSLFEVNALLNNVDKLLKGKYNIMLDKKVNFNTKFEYALTFKLYTVTLFHIAAKLTKYYIRDIVNELTRYDNAMPANPLNRNTTKTSGLALFTYSSLAIFVENDDAINRTNTIALNLQKMFEKLNNNGSFIKNIAKYFKDYIDNESSSSENKEAAQEIIEDFREIKYNKLYYDSISKYLDSRIETKTNLFENVVNSLNKIKFPDFSSILLYPGPSSSPPEGIDQNTFNYIQFLYRIKPSLVYLDDILTLNILTKDLTEDAVKKTIQYIENIKANFNAADPTINAIGDSNEKKIISNVNAYFKFMAEMAKNILQIRYFYYAAANSTKC